MTTPQNETSPTADQGIDSIENMMIRDGYMKPPAAAEDLGVSLRWLLDGLNRHGFPHTRMGKAKWLSPEDRVQIRHLCRIPAQPAKIARHRRALQKAA